jgi:hypothetical protein
MSPKPGFRRGILTTQSRPAREYAHSDSHRTFLCGLSMGLNLAKSPLFALCIFQPSSFSQTPLQHARPGRGSLGGRVARDASPSGDCDFIASSSVMLPPIRVARDASPSGDCDKGVVLNHAGLHELHEMLPRQGIATIRGLGPTLVAGFTLLHEMLPRQGIATLLSAPLLSLTLTLHEMLPRQGIATPFPPRVVQEPHSAVARDASPSGDCDASMYAPSSPGASRPKLHEMLPRQGIATLPARWAMRTPRG